MYRRCYVTGEHEERIYLDCKIWFGDSGSGMIRNGQIVGVISGIRVDRQFVLAFAFPMKFTDEQWELMK